MIERKKHQTDDSCPVSNNFEVFTWINKHQIKCIKKNQQSLLSSSVDVLTKKFGDPHKTYSSKEYKPKLWAVTYEGLDYNIFTADGYGTSVEVCGFGDGFGDNSIKSKDVGKKIIKFLEELHLIILGKNK
jgi:hypothetical protein